MKNGGRERREGAKNGPFEGTGMDDVTGYAHVKMRKTGSHQRREQTVIMRWKESYRASIRAIDPLWLVKSPLPKFWPVSPVVGGSWSWPGEASSEPNYHKSTVQSSSPLRCHIRPNNILNLSQRGRLVPFPIINGPYLLLHTIIRIARG